MYSNQPVLFNISFVKVILIGSIQHIIIDGSMVVEFIMLFFYSYIYNIIIFKIIIL